MMNISTKRLMLAGFAFITLISAGAARAQDVQIQYPQPGQAVRGEITVRFSGIPDGGYAVVKIDGNFTTATSQNTFLLNTMPPNFPGDGTHKISITGINAGGKAVGTAEVSFEIANNRYDPTAGSTRLVHYTAADRVDPYVQRYRVYAVSDAWIEGGGAGGAGGGAPGGGAGGMGGAGGEGEQWIPAPLDWQVAALMRRIVRDIGMFSDDRSEGVSSANIKTIMQNAFERQRQSEGGRGGGAGGPGGAGGQTTQRRTSRRNRGAPKAPSKAPWKTEWERAPETGQYFVKMIEPSGKEINATRKAPTIALADLLPTFPTTAVSPGSTWETRMTFVGDLSSREPINVSVPITLTTFENFKTPAGFERNAAKLESRFQMPDDLAKRGAINLILQGGGSGGAGGGGGGAGPGDASGGTGSKPQTVNSLPANELKEYMDSITTIRTTASRVLWFDVKRNRVLRSEDRINSYFEYEPLEGGGEAGAGMGGGPGAGGGGGGSAGAEAKSEPSKIAYTLTVTTWFDDTVPAPTDRHNGGVGTAHSRDNVIDPTIERIAKPNQP